MGIKDRDLGDVARQLVPNPGDEVWYSDVDQHLHTHGSDDTREPHADGYHMFNDGTGARYEKYHSDDD